MKAPEDKKESTINIGLGTQCFLTSIPSSWEGLEAVTNASSIFYNCTSIARIPASWEGLDENGNFTGVCP
jgi:hypothetical protein